VKQLQLLACAIALAGASFSTEGPALAEVAPIVVLSAVFGPPKAPRPLDFTVKLADTCGPSSNYCQSFCTRAAVGHSVEGRPLFLPPPHSVCRVSYRCGATLTRVAEADENDTFTLSCRARP
jgi:hypothetical protein